MWLKQVETRLWLYQCSNYSKKKTEGVFQADGASPLEALLLQHHQVNEYRQPQIILSLRKRISSMKMTHLITSHVMRYMLSCLHLPSNASQNHRDILCKIRSVFSELSAFFYYDWVFCIYWSKWFDVMMTCLDSTCFLFVKNLRIKINITPHRPIV